MILAVITGVEVAVYYIPAARPFIAPILIFLSAVKFWMVIAFFMHLKFDHVSFSWYFGGGLALALTMASSVVVLQIATHGLPKKRQFKSETPPIVRSQISRVVPPLRLKFRVIEVVAREFVVETG